MKYIPGTIFVTFNDASDAEIEACLRGHDLFGTRVSSIGNRWAIEVPVGKEQEFIKKFASKDIVGKVSESFIPGHVKVSKKREDKEEKDDVKDAKDAKPKKQKQPQPQKKLRGGV